MEISSPEASKELIRWYWNWYADWVVEEDVKGELVSLQLGKKKLARTWGISVKKGRTLNKAERMFINIAEQSGCHWMLNKKL